MNSLRIQPSAFALLFLAFANQAIADEPVNIVRTSGAAEIEKVSDFMLFSMSKKYPIRVPTRINSGDSFDIAYQKDGRAVGERFTVVGISIRGDLCWLHRKQRYLGDSSHGDTIYVKPCALAR